MEALSKPGRREDFEKKKNLFTIGKFLFGFPAFSKDVMSKAYTYFRLTVYSAYFYVYVYKYKTLYTYQ